MRPPAIPLTKIDADGVPRIVQHLSYVYSTMTFTATLFDGSSAIFAAEWLSDNIGLGTTVIREEEMADAYAAAEQLMRERFARLYRN